MSLVWSLIASFLYVEIFIVLMLVLPVASPQRWQRFFKSRFLAMLSRQAQTYFYLLLFVLVLFLLEAIREMRKYSHNAEPTAEQHLNVGMQHSMRLFRAQRNFYISGFAIFLCMVIRRLVSLITTQAQLLAQSEASMKQAQSATAAARSLMTQQKDGDDKPKDGDKPKPSAPSADEVKVDELKQRIAELEGELTRERKDKEAMKSQSESLNREYDRLTEEYSKLQKRIAITSNDKSD
ncbi:B-cell receptor-associated protein 31 isoform X1 [Culex quinquefasciatus]|uniref:B-cell receptor-associated protein 31 isoform X1 n=1 Tax=Culex quinquefasciatus TaxID=7176 RepID=UPI0018E39BBE|nr:B-cell receptor-associated protein 31 isoform X1 [Culex quinquefasciatus]XP_038108689.1 B-cell receptor-associated protein 31 isoform X1 [Culex quinquefasciatus]XP_039439339.1 B-cell receptor-associated protein 31 isoform X1 [Culex pipiens pallens]